MVDFETFAEAINTLFPDGVEITAKFGTVNGESVSSVEVPDDLNAKDGVVPNQTIKVGKQRMDGRTLLNYARFRKDDDGDYGRTKRQQQRHLRPAPCNACRGACSRAAAGGQVWRDGGAGAAW